MFDLHDSMRRAKRVDELEPLYNTTFKAVTDAYFKGVRLRLKGGVGDCLRVFYDRARCFAGMSLDQTTHFRGAILESSTFMGLY